MSAPNEISPAERSRRVLQTLVLERQRLRSTGADDATLEANRLAIEYWRDRVTRARRVSSPPSGLRPKAWARTSS